MYTTSGERKRNWKDPTKNRELSCLWLLAALEVVVLTTSGVSSDKIGIINTLRPRQNGRHFPDDIFKWISLNENVWNSINISLKFVPRGAINNIPTMVQVMAWRRSGDKPLSEPMMVRLPTHICVTRPQWVKSHGFQWTWNLKSSCPVTSYIHTKQL